LSSDFGERIQRYPVKEIKVLGYERLHV